MDRRQTLKEIYPRRLRIARNRKAKVMDCFRIDGGLTRWEIDFRR